MINAISYQEQIQTTMKIYCTPIRMARIKKPTIPSVDEDAEQLEFSHNVGRNPNRNGHFGEQFDRFFFLLKTIFLEMF